MTAQTSSESYLHEHAVPIGSGNGKDDVLYAPPSGTSRLCLSICLAHHSSAQCSRLVSEYHRDLRRNSRVRVACPLVPKNEMSAGWRQVTLAHDIRTDHRVRSLPTVRLFGGARAQLPTLALDMAQTQFHVWNAFPQCQLL